MCVRLLPRNDEPTSAVNIVDLTAFGLDLVPVMVELVKTFPDAHRFLTRARRLPTRMFHFWIIFDTSNATFYMTESFAIDPSYQLNVLPPNWQHQTQVIAP